jgi:hypothetical protein
LSARRKPPVATSPSTSRQSPGNPSSSSDACHGQSGNVKPLTDWEPQKRAFASKSIAVHVRLLVERIRSTSHIDRVGARASSTPSLTTTSLTNLAFELEQQVARADNQMPEDFPAIAVMAEIEAIKRLPPPEQMQDRVTAVELGELARFFWHLASAVDAMENRPELSALQLAAESLFAAAEAIEKVLRGDRGADAAWPPESPSEKEPSTIKELQVPRMADDVEVSSAFPVTMVDFTTTQLLARGLVSA